MASRQTPRAEGARRLRLQSTSFSDIGAQEWDDLARRADTIFGTKEWLSTWWSHFGRRRPLLLSCCRDAEGRLVAIVPLYLWSSRPLRVIRFLGHGAADELGPICAREDRPAVATLLRRALRDGLGRWQVLLGEQLSREAGWDRLLGARVIGGTASPLLRAGPGGWDAFLAARSANFRGQVRRRERALRRDHQVRFRLADDPAALPGRLDALFGLHAARWRDGGSDFPALEAFHREFAALALERGWLRLWVLEVDGRPAAAWYGFRFAGAELFYQSGHDPRLRPQSVGFVLLAHTVREALEDGVGEYRLLRGDESYKSRFSTHDPGLDTIAAGRGLLGRAALAAAAAARRNPALEARLRRAFG